MGSELIMEGIAGDVYRLLQCVYVRYNLSSPLYMQVRFNCTNVVLCPHLSEKLLITIEVSSLIQLHTVTRPTAIEVEHKPHLYAHLNEGNNAGSTQANAAELVRSEYAVVLNSILLGSSWVSPIVHFPVVLQMLSPNLYALCYAHCVQVIKFP